MPLFCCLLRPFPDREQELPRERERPQSPLPRLRGVRPTGLLYVCLGVPPVEPQGEPESLHLRERGVEFAVPILGEREQEREHRGRNGSSKRTSFNSDTDGRALVLQQRWKERLRRSSDSSTTTALASGSFTPSLDGGIAGVLGVMVASSATQES